MTGPSWQTNPHAMDTNKVNWIDDENTIKKEEEAATIPDEAPSDEDDTDKDVTNMEECIKVITDPVDFWISQGASI